MRSWVLLLCLAAPLLAESAAGIKWTVPTGWSSEGSRPMRAATYSVPATAGDADKGECVVYFFGVGQGGSVEANIQRWKGQFKTASPARVNKRTIHGLPVTTVDISGEYAGMGGPMTTQKTSKTGYRLLGAIIEGHSGNLFVKFTAPAKTIAANQVKFEQFLASFTPER